ncbi:MAG: RsmE family RNA methyltransferase [Bacteroidetes bacterium]|nr:RsmE family RNA methyltransferase [Bacteroidota bacterium]
MRRLRHGNFCPAISRPQQGLQTATDLPDCSRPLKPQQTAQTTTYLMEWFYVPALAEVSQGVGIGSEVDLPEAEARHCLTVLRHREGDVLHLVDGCGGRGEARLVQADKRQVRAVITAFERDAPDPAVAIHLAIAPVKNPARMEWFLEKATEIGVSCITPVWTQRGERRHGSSDRWQRVLVAAMKQSGRSWLPELREPIKFSDLMRSATEPCRLIAHCGPGERRSVLQAAQPGQPALLLVGPEGDFSPDEVALAESAGFVPVHLGASRLRTETAGVVAVHLLNLAGAVGA